MTDLQYRSPCPAEEPLLHWLVFREEGGPALEDFARHVSITTAETELKFRKDTAKGGVFLGERCRSYKRSELRLRMIVTR